MSLPRFSRLLRRGFQRLANTLQPGGLILAYHRVASLDCDPWSMAVTPEHFRQQMQVLATRFTPLPLAQLLAGARAGRLPQRAVAVTFDDGYADVYHQALPILQAFAIPATVYLTGDLISPNHEYWWDELELIILQTPSLPPILELPLGGQSQQWSLREDDQAAERQLVYREVWQELHQMRPALREISMRCLRDWAATPASARSTHRVLDPQEITWLASNELVEIGGHTASHPSLATLPPEEQLSEICANKTALESLVRKPLYSFAYPFGKRGDFSRETLALVKAAGYRNACMNETGSVHRWTDPYRLPRKYIQDWRGETFEQALLHEMWG